MLRRKTFFLLLLSFGLLLNCDDDVPWLEFPSDLVSRHYKIGNVASGAYPTDPESFLETFTIMEGLSNGGGGDIAVVTVPVWVNWDGYITEEVNNLCLALRNYNVEIHFVVDPLPHRYHLGGQEPPPPGSNFAGPAVRQKYKDYVLDVIDKTSAEYITLGVEINMYYYGAGMDDFGNLNSLINETADLVRAASPATKILASFQWEQILFNMESIGWEPIENYEWNLDILGISSFPSTALVFQDPSRLPPNYYTLIFDHFPPNHTPETLALAFAELGFPSLPEVDCDGSEKHQVNGVATLIELATQFEHLEFVNYWHLHDHNGYHKQNSYGLIESATTPGGTPGRMKPAYYIWEQLGQLPYIPNPIMK